MQETEVSVLDTPNSLHPNLVATESTSKEKDQSLATIEEYGNTLISLIRNLIPTQMFCANGLNMMITPVNERKRSQTIRAHCKHLQWCQIENQQSPIYVVNSPFSRSPEG